MRANGEKPDTLREAVDRVSREEMETFLRNVPHPVLLGVYGDNCPPCEEMEDEITRRTLPEGMAFAKTTLGNEPDDEEVADLLEVDEFPTVIAFCQGEEVGRTSDPTLLDELLAGLQRCGGEV